MSDRIHFPRDTRLTTDMLNSSFDYLELADQRLLSDLGIVGIVAGLNVTPLDDGLTLCVSPGIAYDHLGRRIKVETTHHLDLSSDAHTGWVSVLVKFARREADPILDSWGRTVAQRLFESCVLVVRPQAADGPSLGTAPVGEDEVLVCDVRLGAGQKAITQKSLDFSRRAYPVFWRASGIGTDQKRWKAVEPASTVQEALDNVDASISEHSNAKMVRVDAGPGRWSTVAPATTAQEALDHVDRAIHEQSTASGVAVDNTGWQAIRNCNSTQEALGHLDGLAMQQTTFQRSTGAALSQVEARFEQLVASPREFSARLHAVVVFQDALAIHAISPGAPLTRQIAVRGIRKGDVVLSITIVNASTAAFLSFEPIEAFADNFVWVRISTPGSVATPEIKVVLRVVVAVSSPLVKTGHGEAS
jgi:hypothetical protein